MQHQPLRPEEQFGGAQHQRVFAAIERVAQDDMNELVDEQRRQMDRT